MRTPGSKLSSTKAPGADRLRPVLEAVRHHQKVIVGKAIGKVGVGGGERDLDLMVVELLDVGDALHRRGAAGFRFAPVKVERIDRVVGGEFLAVREGHALAQLEDPVLGAVGRLPALRQLRMRASVLVPFGEAVPDSVVDVDHHGIGGGAEVQAVGGAAAGKAELQRAAALGRLGGDRAGAGQQGGDREARGAERGGAAHEVAAREGAVEQAPFQ